MKKYIVSVIFLCVIATVCHAEERWALIVGIDQYSSDIITPLKGAERDAHALRDMLVKYARFPSDNIFCLTSNDRANMPNLGNIVTKLDYIASKAKPGDVFLFFFAGHGVSLNSQNYLLVYESDIRSFLLPKTALSVEELNQYLSEIQSGNTILILDACRNNPSAGRGDEDNLMSDSFVKSVTGIRFRSTIYACDTGQRAYEWPGRDRGFFSLTLENALSGKADDNNDGNVTLNEMGSYLADRVPDLVKRELGRAKTQVPRIDISGDPRAGSMVFSWVTKKQEETTASREIAIATDSPGAGQGIESLQANPDVKIDEAETPESGIKPLTQQEKAEGWLDVTGECYGENITSEEAQRSALDRARRNAIETALGANVPIRRALIRSVQDFQRAFAVLSQSDLYGRIAEEKEPVWTIDESIQIYRAALRVKVSKEKSQPDPGFGVSLRLNNRMFLNGEEMAIAVTPTQDCYITIFNILSDRTVLALDTSQGQTSTATPGKRTSFFPSEAERQSGKCLHVAMQEGRIEDIGSVLVIATRDDIPFLSGGTQEFYPNIALTGEEAVLGILPTYKAALDEINAWLAGIPLARRAFDIQQYTIKKKG